MTENSNKIKMAQSDKEFSVNLSQFQKEKDIANITSDLESKMKEAELRKQLEQKNMEAELEKLRAVEYTKTVVNAEKQIKETEGHAQSTKTSADAELYKNQKHTESELYNQLKLAEAIKAKSEAEAYGEQIKLEALAKGTKAKLEAEASGVHSLWQAQASGLKQLFESAGNNPDLVKYYLQLEFAKKAYPEIAEQSAKAIQGLNPKINIWSTGSNDSNPLGTIKNLTTSIPPLLEFLKQNTGVDVVDYFSKSNPSSK